MKFLFLLTAALLAKPALGTMGDEKGNGGDAVVCRNAAGSISSVEMLDYFEARALRGIEISLPSGNSPEEIAVKALESLRHFSPIRAAGYAEAVRNFSKETRFVPGVDLVDIPDSDHIAVPRGCLIEQLVVQQQKQFPEDARFVVNQDLWAVMDNAQKAGAMLHEAFYTEALTAKHHSSRYARYFHAKMVSKDALLLSDLDFMNLVLSAKFPLWELREVFSSSRQTAPAKSVQSLEPRFFTFSNSGALIKFTDNRSGYSNFPVRLSHSMIQDEKPNYSDSYSTCASFVEFSEGPGGRTVAYSRTSNAWRIINLNGQNVWAGLTITLHPDDALEIATTRRGGDSRCYVDPKSGVEGCGRIIIERDGTLRDQPLKDLQVAGWTFTDPSGNTQVKRTKDGLRFLAGSADARAIFTWDRFTLEFSDLADLRIGIDGRPASLKENGIKVNTGTYSERPLPNGILLLNPGLTPEDGRDLPAFLHLGGEYPRSFFLKSQIPLNLHVGFIAYRSNTYELRTVGEYSAFPLDGLTVRLQGKTLKTEPDTQILIGDSGLAFFRLSKHMQPTPLKMKDGTKKTAKPGDFVRLEFSEDVICLGPNCK